MLTPAHIGASYLLSQVPSLAGHSLSTQEVLAVVIVGNIVDLDFMWGILKKKKGDDHHNFVTHTPIFVITAWLLLFLLFNNVFNLMTWVMILISGLLHLVLDDVGYWFCRLGWQKISKYPQINWFYPLTRFKKRAYEGTNAHLLKDYFTKAKVSVALEVVFIFAALVVFLVRS